MRILHYFLGFPPYRSGGMTRFCHDLMKSQAETGNEVSALWPGRMNKGKVSIRPAGKKDGISSYELVNPLPVPLDEGILDIAAYTASCGGEAYGQFLAAVRPEIIHIHTLMGLHREFLAEAEKQGIGCVFTAHDFFGICPKIILFRNGKVCEDDENCGACANCCRRALPVSRIAAMQSPLYRALKEAAPVRRLRERHRSRFFEKEKQSAFAEKEAGPEAEAYQSLREYYRAMVEKMRTVHFASPLTKAVYERYVTAKNSRIIPLAHRDIADRRAEWKQKTGPIRYAFFSGAKPYKGYDLILSVFDALWAEGKRDLELRVYGSSRDERPYLKVISSGFRHDELASVLNAADAVLVPSLCYETFGFAVPEAVSFGVPVIASSRVGAKTMLWEGGIVFDAEKPEELKQIIAGMDRARLEKLHVGTLSAGLMQWPEVTEEILKLYREACV